MESFSALQQLVPELGTLLERRYNLLQVIRNAAPAGRRQIAARLGSSERIVRGELDLLREQNLIFSTSQGVRLSLQGEKVLIQLRNTVRKMHDLEYLEKELASALGISRMIIVSGDADSDPGGQAELALATARFLYEILRPGNILGVTGGTTLARVAESFRLLNLKKEITVVPVRGGLGEDVKIQASTIAARLAENIGGGYRLLHAPEAVLPRNLEQILNEPRIRDVIALGRRAHVLLHGIGTAEEMAKRRGFDEETIMRLIADGAVGEAFGSYFDAAGNIVYNTASVGLRLEDLEKIPVVAAVGGGKSKAWAVMSVLSRGYCDVCITDEGLARRLIALKDIKKEEF